MKETYSDECRAFVHAHLIERKLDKAAIANLAKEKFNLPQKIEAIRSFVRREEYDIKAQSYVVDSRATRAVLPLKETAVSFSDTVKRIAEQSAAKMVKHETVQRHYYIPEDVERVGILADIHGTHRDERALDLAINYLKDKDIDCLVLAGDCVDNASVSRWPTPMDVKAAYRQEIEDGKSLFKGFESFFPKIPLYLIFGNHEDRFMHYIHRRAPELFGLDAVCLEQILSLNLGRYQVIDEQAILHVGNYNVIHGDEYVSSGGQNPARNLYMKTGAPTICGHLHHTSNFQFRKITGEVDHAHVLGCLCHTDPSYRPFNNWSQGFGYLEKKKGKWQMHNMKIEDGEIYNSMQ